MSNLHKLVMTESKKKIFNELKAMFQLEDPFLYENIIHFT